MDEAARILAQGLIDGIKAGLPEVERAIRLAVHSVLEAAERELGNAPE